MRSSETSRLNEATIAADVMELGASHLIFSAQLESLAVLAIVSATNQQRQKTTIVQFINAEV